MNREHVIHLTGRPSVRIDDEEWPVIGRATWPTDKAESGRSVDRAYVRVRRHDDGRTIVYGLRAEGSYEQKVGFLLDAGQTSVAEITEAIHKACALVGIEPQQVFDDLPPETL